MRWGVVLLEAAVLLSMLVACVGTQDETAQEGQQPLQYWSALHCTGNDKTAWQEWEKQLEKETGVRVEWVQLPEGQIQDAFHLMMVSNQLPDFIEYDWYHISGGPDRAVEHKMIRSLNQLLESDSPNLKALYGQRKDYAAQMRSANGHYYMYPWICSQDNSTPCAYAWMRGDLVQQLPVTMEDWHQALRELKNAGIAVPLCIRMQETQQDTAFFAAAFGVNSGFYIEEETVKFGPYDPGWQEVIQMLRQWYQEGLLQIADTKKIQYWMKDGSVGSVIGTEEEWEQWQEVLTGRVPGALLQEVQPCDETAQRIMLGKEGVQPYGTAVSAQCKQPRAAARMLDYGYGAAGQRLYNEGFKQASGTSAQAQAPSWKARPGPYVQVAGIETQSVGLAYSSKLPLTYFTEEEQQEYDKITQELVPWITQTVTAFVSGQKPMEEWEAYRQQMWQNGLEKALPLQQRAYDRYREQTQ